MSIIFNAFDLAKNIQIFRQIKRSINLEFASLKTLQSSKNLTLQKIYTFFAFKKLTKYNTLKYKVSIEYKFNRLVYIPYGSVYESQEEVRKAGYWIPGIPVYANIVKVERDTASAYHLINPYL